ncbi:MAML2 protein, partial [Polyodon spathula]|nr:MAML2 protein [Polyodon spathula]
MTNHHFPQRAMAPPSQIASDISMHPLNSMDQTISGQAVAAARGLAPRPSQPRMPALPTMASMNQLTPIAPVNSGTFTAASQNSRCYQGNSHSSDLTFDFLQQGDNTVPGINSDSDFIDSLLKSGSGNDDWMKDINLDEILGSHS